LMGVIVTQAVGSAKSVGKGEAARLERGLNCGCLCIA
jgi:hypothetical protein